jgi:hypothetical protein
VIDDALRRSHGDTREGRLGQSHFAYHVMKFSKIVCRPTDDE